MIEMRQHVIAVGLTVLLLLAGCSTITPDQPGQSTSTGTESQVPTSIKTAESTTSSLSETGTVVTPQEPIGRIDQPLPEYPNYPFDRYNYTARYYNLLVNPVDMDELTRYNFPPDPDLQDRALPNVSRFETEQVNEETTQLNIGVDVNQTEQTNSVLSRTFMRYAFVLDQSIQDNREWGIDEINLEVSVDGQPYRANRIDAADALSWTRYRDGANANISMKLERHLLSSQVYNTGWSFSPTANFEGESTAEIDAPQYRQVINDDIGDRAQVQRAQRHGRVLYVDYVSETESTNIERRLSEFTAAAFGYGRAVENGAPDTAYVLITEKIRHENGTLDTMGYVRVSAEQARDAYTGETGIEEFTGNVTDWYYDEDHDLNT